MSCQVCPPSFDCKITLDTRGSASLLEVELAVSEFKVGVVVDGEFSRSGLAEKKLNTINKKVRCK
jgi:hypothetical protein